MFLVTAKLAFLLVSSILVNKEAGSKTFSGRRSFFFASPLHPKTLKIFFDSRQHPSNVVPVHSIFRPNNKTASYAGYEWVRWYLEDLRKFTRLGFWLAKSASYPQS